MPSTRNARQRWRAVLVVLAALSLLLTLVVGAGTASAKHHTDDIDYWLTVLHNNDGESELLPFDLGHGDGEIGGIGRFAAVRTQAEKQAQVNLGDGTRRGVIMVSSGDNFLAGPEFNASLADGVWYDAMALDMLSYDGIALGNHDFDFGPDVLTEFISDGFRKPGRPPYVSANLDFSGEPGLQALVDDGAIAASTVVKKTGEDIGIIGATTTNLPFISSPRNVVVNEVIPAVQAEIDALEAIGVDKIVFISHLQDVEADVALAGELTGVDIMIAGGGDELLANPDDLLLPGDAGSVFGPYPIIAIGADGAEIPVVTTSGSYGYLGRLTVGFDDEGNVVALDDGLSGPLRIVSPEVGPDGVDPVKRYVNKIEGPVADYVADLAANIIGNSDVDLDGRRTSVRSVETNEGNLIADSLLWQSRLLAAEFGVEEPDVALQNGGGIRNDSIIPAGPISELTTFEMVPFSNFLAVLPDIPRDQFKEILENAVSRNSAGDIPGGTGRFAQVAGFSFVYDGAGTAQELDGDGNVTVAGSRILDIVLDDGTIIASGGAVVPGPDLTVATVDFLARGGDQYPFRGAPFTILGVTYQQALVNYIQDALGGEIAATQYPFGGEGRIVRIN